MAGHSRVRSESGVYPPLPQIGALQATEAAAHRAG